MGYTYYCNSTGFNTQELYNTCEVGDFSGKFGAAVSSTGVFASSDGIGGSILVDPLPPLSQNFKQPMELSQPWNSITFRCNNLPMACATFVKVSDATTSPCAASFKQMDILTSAATGAPVVAAALSDGYSAEEFNAAVISSVLLCIFGGVLLGGVIVYFVMKRASGGGSPLLGGGAKSGDYALYN